MLIDDSTWTYMGGHYTINFSVCLKFLKSWGKIRFNKCIILSTMHLCSHSILLLVFTTWHIGSCRIDLQTFTSSQSSCRLGPYLTYQHPQSDLLNVRPQRASFREGLVNTSWLKYLLFPRYHHVGDNKCFLTVIKQSPLCSVHKALWNNSWFITSYTVSLNLRR